MASKSELQDQYEDNQKKTSYEEVEKDGFITMGTDILTQTTAPLSAFDEQVGGDHYKKYPKGYQPLEVAYHMGMNPFQFSMLKYMLREKVDTVEDIEKLIHVAQMYREELMNE